MSQFETDRLTLRRLTLDDAALILQLLNEPPFLRHIGDRGVHTLADARAYIEHGLLASYERLGFGLFLVELKDTGLPIGICGLLKRPALCAVDLGYALLERYWGQGYAFEAAQAVTLGARSVFGLERLAAVVNPDNQPSISLLKKLGFQPAGRVRLADTAPEILLYQLEL